MISQAAIPSFLNELRSLVGAENVLTDTGDVNSYLTDWRGRYHGEALAVVRPGSTAEVAQVVTACHRAGVPIVPQGGNTGLCGAATPDSSGHAVLVSLRRMNRIRTFDRANATIVVEAGATLHDVQEAAREAGFLFPLSLASEGSCLIGGNISTNAGGTAVLRHGPMRQQVLGLEVVLPDGRIWNGLRGLRKDNTGYDLKQLFVGAEGTLGIITTAVLQLQPMPRVSATVLAGFPSLPATVEALFSFRQKAGDRLTGFEIWSALCAELLAEHQPKPAHPLPGHAWYALIQLDDAADHPAIRDALNTVTETTLSDLIERKLINDAVLAQSDVQAKDLWALREHIPLAEKAVGISVKHDISLPVSSVAAFVDAAEASLNAQFPGARIVCFGHLGDGNLHFNVSFADSNENSALVARSRDVNRLVHDLVHENHGSISAEHGIGQLKREEITRYKLEVELDLMRRIKATLDPEGLMNPGKVL